MFFITILFFSNAVFAQNTTQQNEIQDSDKKEIFVHLHSLVTAITDGNGREAASLVSPNNSILQKEVYNAVQSKLNYDLEINSIEAIEGNKIKVECTFSVAGNGWRTNGLSNYFVFEKYADYWLISDTDFHKKMSKDYTFGVIKKVMSVFVPLLLIFGIFWFWMLIDCIKNETDNKTVWVIILIFLNILGAILYFFMARRKRNQAF